MSQSASRNKATAEALRAWVVGNPSRIQSSTVSCDKTGANAWLICEHPMLIENGIMDRVRMDKWLWAARFFKTRALAARACELGRIECSGQHAKASREVHVGDLLQVKSSSGDFQIEVLLITDMRGPAAVAQTLYRESEESRELRRKLAEERKAVHFEAFREGRPSKRDRRQLARLRNRP